MAFGDIFLHLLTGHLTLLSDEFGSEDFCSVVFDGFLLTSYSRWAEPVRSGLCAQTPSVFLAVLHNGAEGPCRDPSAPALTSTLLLVLQQGERPQTHPPDVAASPPQGGAITHGDLDEDPRSSQTGWLHFNICFVEELWINNLACVGPQR